MPLSEQHRQKLDSIVQQMTANRESDENIQLVVNDFKQKYGDSIALSGENQKPQPSVLSKAADVANAHAFQSLGGGTFTDIYDAAGEGLKQVAERALGEKYAVTREKLPFLKGAEFMGQVARAVPETADAMLTPFGAATTAILGLAGPRAKAAAGAAFSTAQAKEIPQRAKEAIENPTPQTVGNVFKDTAMTAAPVIPAFLRRKPATVSNAQRELALAEDPISEPVRKGGAIKSAAESAEVFSAEPLPKPEIRATDRFVVGAKRTTQRPTPEGKPINLPWLRKTGEKSARESAATFEGIPEPKLARESAEVFLSEMEKPKTARESATVLKQAADPLRGKPRDVRRAASMPPEEGVPEQLDRFSDEMASKPYNALDPAEKQAVDQLWMERRRQTQGGAVAAQGKPIAPQVKPVEEQYFNFKRVRISPEEEALIRQRLREMDAAGEISKDVEPHAAIIAEAKNIDPSLVREVSNESGIRGRAARQVMRERINSLSRELATFDEKLRGKTPEEAAALEADRARMSNDLNSYLKEFAGIRTEAGRNLAALKMMARNTLDIEWWMNEAKRSAKLPSKADLPEAKAKRVRELVVKAQDADASGDAAAAEAAKSNLAREVAKMRENGLLETAVALWRTGLLTGPKTHMRNILGNVGFAVMEEAAKAPAWMVDLAWSLKSGKRTQAAPNPMSIYNAMMEAATRGVKEARQVFTRGGTPADMAKGELAGEWNYQGLRNLAEKTDNQLAKKVLGTTNDLINRYINTVGRALGAEDKIFKVYAIRRGIEAQARIKALNEMKAGAIPERELARRAQQLIENPTETMTAEAIAYADFATFNNENSAANAVGRFASALGPAGKAVTNVLLPFRRTPFNIFNRMMDYTPIGMAVRPVLEVYSAKHKGKPMPDMQRVVSDAVGRGLTGTALLALGWKLGMEDKATGTGQEDPSRRKVQQAAGRMPGSVQIGSDWYKTAGLAPAGALIQIGAQLAREQSKSLKDELKRPLNIAKVGTRAILEQPMMQAARETVESLENPDSRAESMAASRTGSLVPAVVNDIATLTNPQPAEFKPMSGSGILESAAHGVKARLPWLRGTLPAATDVFGRPVEGRQQNAVNPFTPSRAKEQTDPMFKELIALDIGFSGPKPQPGESAEEFRERKILAGAVAERAVRDTLSEAPQDKDERRDALRKAIIRAESSLTRYIKSDDFQSMSPQERIEEMRYLTTTYR